MTNVLLGLIILMMAIFCIFKMLKNARKLVFELIPLLFSVCQLLILIVQNCIYEFYMLPFFSGSVETITYFGLCLFFINTGTSLRGNETSLGVYSFFLTKTFYLFEGRLYKVLIIIFAFL